MKKYRFQLIQFYDHHRTDEWVNPVQYVQKKIILEYTGWLIFENKQRLLLAQGRDKEDLQAFDGLMNIEKANIISRRTIKGL